MKLTHGYRWLQTLLAAVLLAACSNDTPDTSAEAQEIRFNADVWHVMDGTRSGSGATTFNSADDLQSEGFKCTLYGVNTDTKYGGVDNINVNWSSSAWAFSDGTHKWPDNDGVLDFFAYSPQDVNPADPSARTSYITALSYTVSGEPAAPAPSFSCTLPNDQTGLKEFIWALTPGQSRLTSASGVLMNFVHPFARIRFALSPSSGSNVEVTGVHVTGSFYMSGICTLSADGTTSAWSTSDRTSGEIGGEIDKNYIAIPQTVGTHNVVVSAKWSEWSKDVTQNYNVSVSVPQWQPGKSYTYTLTLSPAALKVDVAKYTEQW